MQGRRRVQEEIVGKERKINKNRGANNERRKL